MLDFIVKYWLQELFGVIAIALGFLGRRAWKQWTEAKQLLKEKQEKDHESRIFAKLDEHFDNFDNRLNDIDGRFEEVDGRFDDLVLKLNALEEHDV